MRTETHGDFTQRSWCDTFGQRHCEVTHVPTGLMSSSMSHGIYTDEIDAWKGMAMKLSQRLTCLNNVTSPDGPTFHVKIEPTFSLTAALENCPDGAAVRIDEL